MNTPQETLPGNTVAPVPNFYAHAGDPLHHSSFPLSNVQVTCDTATNCKDPCNTCDIAEDACIDMSPMPTLCQTSMPGQMGHCVASLTGTGTLHTCQVSVAAEAFASCAMEKGTC